MKYSVLLLLLSLAGCMAQPTVTSWLDPVSVATITSQTQPLVLARVTSSSKINRRDFAQLMAIEVNRMGARRLYLTLIPRTSGDLTPKQMTSFESSFGEIEIRTEERMLVLNQYAGDVAELGIGDPTLPLPISGSTFIYYPIERDDLRALATSTRIELAALGVPNRPQYYEEWKDGRRSLSDFLGQLPGETSAAQRGEAP
ncbi:hypothetical protein JM946_14725 [Steroidobacter sp. S1-65]|uniref:Uncharacterized protein n=1 Tax=Steroidobacter gossypii TaxID=2805490 RepID=A0ABS1WYC2_9GAMM|nr:hypothetical protein [Steroidobacter gossypii]MBM0105984.1 hypothetical protein [Steroidobacter gossypii]